MAARCRWLLFLALCALAPAGPAAAEVRDVHVAALVIDVDEVDSVTQRFVANFYIETRWSDPALVHPGPDSISRDLDDIWYPRIQIVNEQQLRPTFPQSAEIRPNGEVIYRQRYWGSLSQPLELHEFPFDSQRLSITLINVRYGAIEVNLVADESLILGDSLQIPEWRVMGTGIDTREIQLGTARASRPGADIWIDIERELGFFLLKVILPLMLIVAMSWAVFWLDPTLSPARISIAVTTVLTLIAYRFAIGGMVPRLGFLTSLDYFVLVSTVLVFVNLAAVIYSTNHANGGALDKAQALNRRMRWLAPGLYLLATLETLVLRTWI